VCSFHANAGLLERKTPLLLVLVSMMVGGRTTLPAATRRPPLGQRQQRAGLR